MGESPRFYFLYGNDAYGLRRRAEELSQELTQGGQSLEIFQAQGTTVTDAEQCLRNLQDSLRSRDLFASQRVFWLKQIDFLADSPIGHSEAMGRALEEFIATWKALGEGPCICSACPVDRRTRIFKQLCALGQAEFFPEAKTLAEVLPRLRKMVQRESVTLEDGTAELLIERVGLSHQALAQEIEKLSLYVGPGGHLTPALVRELVPELQPDEFFEAVELFYAADLAQALRGLERYFIHHREARPLLAALQQRNRLMLVLRYGVDTEALTLRPQRLSQAEWEAMAAHYQSLFPPKEKNGFQVFQANFWYLSRLAGDLAPFSLAALLSFQQEFIETFSQLIRFHEHAEELMRSLFRRCLALAS
ncbi:MAG: hypothetical protein LBT57_01660 [Puniceicoccales bacterium]|jgi:DNA polymerase-3 subunit delta|nr:hypothetical protein [Puniceicoccales bacterium]